MANHASVAAKSPSSPPLPKCRPESGAKRVGFSGSARQQSTDQNIQRRSYATTLSSAGPINICGDPTMAQSDKSTVVVIGAGIIGLSSALTLLENLPRSQYNILLVSDYFSADGPDPSFPSTAAGAHYRPIPATTPQLKREAQLANVTYHRFKELSVKFPGIGVQFLEGIDYVSGEATPAYTALLPEYAGLEGFRVLGPNERLSNAEFGARYEAYTIDPDVYLFHLLRRFKLAGGQVLRKKLKSITEAFEIEERRVRLVVNCSGTGLGDPKSFIIRGQICLVSNPCDKTITQQHADGSWSFVIPRPLGGGTIVGGTKQPNDWNSTPSLAVRDQLLKKAAEMYPAILNAEGKFDVIRDIIGRRPAREGGPRLEVERLAGGKNVVHAYGAAGRGVELSWGIAEEVWKMVKENLDAPPQNKL
ncbi:hypothetical protein AJ80_01870 [Polytolypa hystricis UAMH7299]|uniref:FAD dependent oxidoreductase domain-containing protein n=1 Tax=Polytolypa hystricis (strain UAMH7299) TaxID=1447883 RepID=A0A2B7YZX7_POLH7|nr:hypothetical protein AJ80_01870 [Polytolypa hystricis UAMH7299]